LTEKEKVKKHIGKSKRKTFLSWTVETNKDLTTIFFYLDIIFKRTLIILLLTILIIFS